MKSWTAKKRIRNNQKRRKSSLKRNPAPGPRLITNYKSKSWIYATSQFFTSNWRREPMRPQKAWTEVLPIWLFWPQTLSHSRLFCIYLSCVRTRTCHTSMWASKLTSEEPAESPEISSLHASCITQTHNCKLRSMKWRTRSNNYFYD